MYSKNQLVKNFFQFQVFLFFLCSCASKIEVERSAAKQLANAGTPTHAVSCSFNKREDGTPTGHSEWICVGRTKSFPIVLVCDAVTKKCRRHQANDLTD